MKKILALSIAAIAILGVISTAVGFGIENDEYFSDSALSVIKYFTIQSNIIVALYFLSISFFKDELRQKIQKFFAPVIAYIGLTFIVFALFLQSIWHPEGFTLIGNILNHYFSPVLTMVFFVIYRKDYSFKFKDIPYWLIYPLAYLGFVLYSGFTFDDWIYPFFDINANGVFSFIIFVLILLTIITAILVSSVLLTQNKKLKK